MISTTTVVLTVLMMAAILRDAFAMIDPNRYDSNGTPYPQLQLGMFMDATSLFKTVWFCELRMPSLWVLVCMFCYDRIQAAH